MARWLAAVAALLILAGGLRWLAFEAAAPVALLGDEAYYAQVADHLARGRGHLYVGALEGPARAWRPPGHPFVLSLAVNPARAEASDPAQDAALVARLQRTQILWGTLLVALTAALGAALFDARTGALA